MIKENYNNNDITHNIDFFCYSYNFGYNFYIK